MMLVESSRVTLTKNLSLLGRSRAGDGTCFVVPELGWMFDCGAPVSGKPVSHLFVTHGHGDHVACLPRTLQQHQAASASCSSGIVRVYVPACVVPLMESYLKAWKDLTDGDDLQAQTTPLTYDLIGVEAGQELEIGCSNRIQPYTVQVLECDHRVTCYGYMFHQKRRRLKPEYRQQIPGNKQLRVKDLQQQGIDPFEDVSEPVFTFLGDTTHVVFERCPEILRTGGVVVVECSFLLDPDLDRALETRHMHWTHLRPLVEAHPETLFILTHFSLKYKGRDIRQFFRDYRNVHAMLTASEIEQHQPKTDTAEARPISCACFRCRPDVNPD